MVRKLSLLFAALMLASCGRGGMDMRTMAPREMAMPDVVVQEKPQIFSYSHTLSLVMVHDAVRARFERARERCVHDAALHCRLLSASENEGGDAISAHLDVALPHDSIAAFEAGLLMPLPADKSGVEVASRSTQTQSVENQANDTDRKVAQLTKYRDGLAALARRTGLSVDDYIRVQQELSQTEASLDEALAAKRDISDRIVRESLSVELTQRVSPMAPVSPIAQVLRDAGDTLTESTAQVLRFTIQIIPWLPLLIAAFFLLRWLFRIARRRPAIAQSPPANTGG